MIIMLCDFDVVLHMYSFFTTKYKDKVKTKFQNGRSDIVELLNLAAIFSFGYVGYMHSYRKFSQ